MIVQKPTSELLPRLAFLLAVPLGLTLLPGAAHAYCYGYNPPIAPIGPSGNVCGTVYKIGYNGTKAAGTSYVKICPAGASHNSSSCSTTTTGSYQDGWGQTVQAYNFPGYRRNASGYANFDFYAWGYYNTDYWGSSVKPIRRVAIGNGLEGISIYMPPRPLNPTPVYPSGTNVPSSYLVRWKSGLDIDRNFYPVRYEVWFKHWPVGGTEPAAWSLSTDQLPCQDNGGGPDANNECSTYVSGPQLPGNWRWYVVANLDVSSQVNFPNTEFTTQANPITFFQP